MSIEGGVRGEANEIYCSDTCGEEGSTDPMPSFLLLVLFFLHLCPVFTHLCLLPFLVHMKNSFPRSSQSINCIDRIREMKSSRRPLVSIFILANRVHL